MGGPGSGRRPGSSKPCGTPAKYQYHRKRGEDCPECRAAHAAMKRAQYKPKTNRKWGEQRSREQALEARQIVLQAKLDRGACEDCQRAITVDNFFAFDLDHIDPAEKSFTISARYKHVSLDALRAEIEKCRLLCAYCHRIRTYRDRHHLLQIAKERRALVAHPSLLELLDVLE